jgi:hypothetical protein
MKKDIIACCIIITMVFALGGIDILGRIFYDDPVRAGDNLDMVVNLENPTSKDIDDLSVKAFILDSGDYLVAGGFDLDDNTVDSKHLYFNVPKSFEKGLHIIKVIVSNDDYYDSKYVYVDVI